MPDRRRCDTEAESEAKSALHGPERPSWFQSERYLTTRFSPPSAAPNSADPRDALTLSSFPSGIGHPSASIHPPSSTITGNHPEVPSNWHLLVLFDFPLALARITNVAIVLTKEFQPASSISSAQSAADFSRLGITLAHLQSSFKLSLRAQRLAGFLICQAEVVMVCGILRCPLNRLTEQGKG